VVKNNYVVHSVDFFLTIEPSLMCMVFSKFLGFNQDPINEPYAS
jgi:hypothetical protein